MPQIFTRITESLFFLRRGAEEFGKRGSGIGSEHQVFTDEKSIEAGRAKFLEVGMRTQPGFADSDTIIGNARDQFERRLHADIESFEVAVVYANDAGARGEGAVKLGGGVDLDNGLHL